MPEGSALFEKFNDIFPEFMLQRNKIQIKLRENKDLKLN